MKQSGLDPIVMEDEFGYLITDYALSDAHSFLQMLHKRLDYPRVMILSDQVFDILIRHPQIMTGIADGWLDTIAGTLLFKALDVVIVSDTRVYDCRNAVEIIKDG